MQAVDDEPEVCCHGETLGIVGELQPTFETAMMLSAQPGDVQLRR